MCLPLIAPPVSLAVKVPLPSYALMSRWLPSLITPGSTATVFHATGAPVAWKTVAVDPGVIKLGSHLDIKAYEGKGTFTAKDTGGAIKGKHIDVFAGAVPIKEAY